MNKQASSKVRRSLWEWLLDASVYYSFDASGYRRHSAHFEPLPSSAEGLQVIVTGANSGIGLACATELARRGASLVMLCRDQRRGEAARARICEQVHPVVTPQLCVADMTDHTQLKRAVEQLSGAVHVLLHNAGLLPLSWAKGACGHELTVGAHLMGPVLLTQLLTPQLIEGGRALREGGAREGARVIWMSSGGMYTKRLSLSALQHLSAMAPERYDGVEAYAYTKRAQVELATQLNLLGHGEGLITHHSAHPGWVDTPGVQTSLPGFWRWTQKRLRSLTEGADTAIWLSLYAEALPPGFWFDRVARSPYLLGGKPSEAEREALLKWINQTLGLSEGWVSA